MLVRYRTDNEGRREKQALLYTKDEHKISRHDVDPDAWKVAHRLHVKGHTAYIVGGAVRDLMLGRRPKDFDVATDAQPNRIRRLFRNSRVIGKRFRLVHVVFGDKIIEVSTFRAADSVGFNNVYGAIEEDARRRDFSVNALYYSPFDETVLDYVGGVEDINHRRLEPVLPLETIFEEDPVRIVRGIKYATSLDLRIPGPVRRRMKKNVEKLALVSPSRITEEVFKILLSGRAEAMVAGMRRLGVFEFLLPAVDARMRENREYRTDLARRLCELDNYFQACKGDADRSTALACLFADEFLAYGEFAGESRVPTKDAFLALKAFIRPVTPANADVEAALRILFRARRRYAEDGRVLPDT